MEDIGLKKREIEAKLEDVSFLLYFYLEFNEECKIFVRIFLQFSNCFGSIKNMNKNETLTEEFFFINFSPSILKLLVECNEMNFGIQ